MRIASRLFTFALLIGALTLALGQTATVRADNFTDVGCPTGNYSCLAVNGGQLPPQYTPYYGQGAQGDPFAAVGCADNDYTCYYAKTGVNYTVQAADPFAAVGCADYDYTCLYNQQNGTGITVNPPGPYNPTGQIIAPNVPAPLNPGYATTAGAPNAIPGVVTTTGR